MSLTFRSIVVAIVAFATITHALPATAAADATPPAIVKAAMHDSDGDGRADQLVLTYSEKVLFEGVSGPGPFAVAGYKVTGVGHTHMQPTVTVVLKEKSAPDPTAKPSVTYTPFACGVPSVVDLAGNEATAQVFDRTRALSGAGSDARAAPAPAIPRIIAGAMIDADGDGRADRLALTYSVKVSFAGEPSGSNLFTVDGYTIVKVPKVSTSRTLTLHLKEKSKADPAAAPDVGYCPPGAGSSDPPVRESKPGGGGSPAGRQVFKDVTSLDDAPSPTVKVVTAGQLGPGIPGKLTCTGAFIKVDFVRVPGSVESTGFGRCRATFEGVPRGASVEISILGTAGVAAATVGGCDTVEAIANTPSDDTVKTDQLTLTRTGFGECVL